MEIIFFFQAEDGIRDWSVTGVQTCALPISRCRQTDALGNPGLAPANRGLPEHLDEDVFSGEVFYVFSFG